MRQLSGSGDVPHGPMKGRPAKPLTGEPRTHACASRQRLCFSERDIKRATDGAEGFEMTSKMKQGQRVRGLSRRQILKTGAGTAALLAAIRTNFPSRALAEGSAPQLEKPDLKFGFIKLTDMAPIAIAKELGFFEDEGLFVSAEPQANWKVLLDRVITG